ncbi:MAG TPA: 3-oxoacyl-ACP synthase III family protein [Euzebya sp.]|nr:3-oxoacyl-ACP synthase III family protein [Euzebya sp.]
MTRAQIVATGGYQPGDPIDNDEILRLVGPLAPDVQEGIAIQRRFWMIDPKTGEHLENNADMGFKAAMKALDTVGAEPGDVELMIYSTGTPEYHLPATVNLVQEMLGIESCATMELRSGGAGGVQGLDIARMMLERGDFRTALVIGAEAISPVMAPIFLGKDPHKIRMRDRMPLYMFGDGAGAFLLQASDDDTGGIIGSATRAIGGLRKPGIQSIGGGTHAPIHEQMARKRLVDLQVDVVGAGDFTPVMVTESLTDTLTRSKIDVSTVDWCLIPEGNVGWMLDSLAEHGLLTPEWKALEGKIFDNLAQTGACGSAAVPLFLDHAWRTKMITPGHRVLLIGVEATKWIYGGAVVDWTAPTPA